MLGNITEERKKAHSRVLLDGRWPGHSGASPEDNKRAYYTATLAEFVEKTLAKSPPLNPEQVERIVALVRAGGTAQ